MSSTSNNIPVVSAATTALLAKLNTYRFNPSAVQSSILDLMQTNLINNAATGTYDIPDASNPFIFLLEANATLGTAGMIENEINTRKLYPELALTLQDLYLHMSDKDYVGLFASPALTQITIAMVLDDIKANVVPTGQAGISQIVLPRETQISVGNYVFTMQYPIQIQVTAYGAIQVLYDVTQPSPLQSLSSNIVSSQVQNINGQDWLFMTIPMYQMQITANYGAINASTGFSMVYDFPDQYQFARVYCSQGTNQWTEIRSTYTDQVFDPTVPTAVLTLLGNSQIQVDIPQIYLTAGTVIGELRIDLYTTQGSIDVDLSAFQIGQYTASFTDLDSSTDPTVVSPYVAPLKVISPIMIYSDQVVVGGSNAPSFNQVRTEVMANATGAPSLPITGAQLAVALQNLGYSSVLNIDNVTNRIYLATRQLPAPTDGSVNAGAGCAIFTLQASMNQLATYSTVRDNGNRITLLPRTLYELNNGIVTLVDSQTVSSFAGMTQDGLINAINAAEYVYTPFYYVLDINGNTFQARSYYLDAPVVNAKSYVAVNSSLGLEVATGSYQFKITTANLSTGDVDGFALYVVTQSSAAFQGLNDSQIIPQLSYIPEGEIDRAYINGVLLGKSDSQGNLSSTGTERLYKFVLGTAYDLDSADNLGLNTFSMFNNAAGVHFAGLTTDFDLVYTVHGYSVAGMVSSSIDQEINGNLVPAGTYGVAQERFNITFGTALTDLWNRARSVVSSQDYARYTADVPYLYTQNVYLTDPTTGQPKITVAVNGTPQFTILHHAGDPVLDINNNPTYRYRVGDVIIDGSGNPVVIVTRAMLRQTDMVFIDGNYWFATAPVAVAYAKSIPQTIVGWLENDIGVISSNLLEQTILYLYLQSTLGQVKAIVTAGNPITINAQTSFTVNYYLTDSNYRNLKLRSSLTTLAESTIAAALQNSTVSINDIVTTITDTAGDVIVGVDVEGLGGIANYTTLTTLDDSIRLSVGKRSVANPDGTIGVVDAITVNFLKHT